MGKRFFALSSAAVLAASAAISLGATAAQADVGDVVCEYWVEDEMYNVRAEQTGERAYTIKIADFKVLAGENEDNSAYVPLPLDPDLRMSTNQVTFDDRLEVSGVSISQGILSGPADDVPYWTIDSYLGELPAPWESVSTGTDGITWLQDMDARSDENGVQAVPSDYPEFFPGAKIDDAAGILEFTVTIPDEVEGEIALFGGMTAAYNGAIMNRDTEEWEFHESLTDTIPGCSVTVEAVTPDETPDPEPAPNPDPDPDADSDPNSGSTPADDDEDSTPSTSSTPVSTTHDALATTGGASPVLWAAGAIVLAVIGSSLVILQLRRRGE